MNKLEKIWKTYIPVLRKHNDFLNILDEEGTVKPEFQEEHTDAFDKMIESGEQFAGMSCMFWDLYFQGISLGMKMGN